jgi:ubiquinone/menaquinone biosynthesis C-methylase UbiE
MKIDDRFSNKIGLEYELFPLACPHYGLLQGWLPSPLSAFASKHKLVRPRILEIGCGTGITTLQVCKQLPRAKVTALDVEGVMLDQARKVVPKNVHLVQADALEYLKAQKPRSFDMVVTAFCLHNMPPQYREDVYREMGRVQYVSRRCIVVIDKIAQNSILQHWEALKAQIEAFAIFREHGHPELQAEWTEHYLQDDRIRFTEKEHYHLLEVAGCTRTIHHCREGMDVLISGTRG